MWNNRNPAALIGQGTLQYTVTWARTLRQSHIVCFSTRMYHKRGFLCNWHTITCVDGRSGFKSPGKPTKARVVVTPGVAGSANGRDDKFFFYLTGSMNPEPIYDDTVRHVTAACCEGR